MSGSWGAGLVPRERDQTAALLDAPPRDALRSFLADLGAERALLLEKNGEEASVLLEAAVVLARAESPSAFAWGDAGIVADDDRILRVPLDAIAGRDLEIVAEFATTERREMTFVPVAVRRLLPLLTACVDLWLRSRSERMVAAGLSSAANLSGLGMLLLDADGRLRFANRTAEALIASGDGLRRDGLRSGGDTIAATSLREAVALRAALDGPEDASSAIRLPRSGNRQPLIVTIVHRAGGDNAGQPPATVIHILDPECDMRALIGPFCRLHRLSAMECELAAELANGGSLKEAAAALGIKVQTARSYLKQIFVKTDAKRQSELVRLMMLSSVHAGEEQAKFNSLD